MSKRKTQEEEDLNWATGLSRWMAKKDAQGCLPEGAGDPGLHRWVEAQRRDYWNWKHGRPAGVGRETFELLGKFGFDWGEEAAYIKADAEGETDAKPRPRRERTVKANAEQDEPVVAGRSRGEKRQEKQSETSHDSDDDSGEERDEAPPKKVARTTRKSPRASVRQTRMKAGAGGPKKEAAVAVDTRRYNRGRTSQRTLPKSETRAKGKAAKASGRKSREENELRIMYRLVPIEEEPRLIDEVKKEFKNLLVCEEPLTEDKAKGVYIQDVRFNQNFERQFLEFLVFKKAYGHGFVPKLFPENPGLGRWTCKLRQWRNKGHPHLTKSRMKRLNAAGFIWDPKRDKEFWKLQADCGQARDLWEENFQDLLKFKEEKGTVIVPKEYAENKRLARWTLKQRRNYKAKYSGGFHTLDDEKERRLIEIGFVFNSRTPEIMRQNVFERFHDRWVENIEKLKLFKERYGHAAVPRRFKSDPRLSSWAMRQRAQWRKLQAGQPSYLTPERLKELTELDFVFHSIDRRNYPVDKSDFWSGPKKNGSGEEEADESMDGEDEGDEVSGSDNEEENESNDDTKGEDDDKDNGDEDETDIEDATDDAAAEEVEEDSKDGPERTLIKGRWTCTKCSKDEFYSFIDACVHEAYCAKMVFKPVDPV